MGSELALSAAMKNIADHFLMVGTLAELDKSYTVMECIMPDYLHGLGEFNIKTDFHKRDKHEDVEPLSSEAREVMEERLENEYKLYEFVRERLNNQYNECAGRNIT